MKSPKNFLSDESYLDLIELCIKKNDKFGAHTFLSEMRIVDHIEETCLHNGVMSSRFEIIPQEMGEECPVDRNFCEDGEDGDYDE